ncbi:MAG: VanZ family protein [Microbacterium arborescens]
MTPTGSRLARALLAILVVALAFIAFWPTPVDRDAGWLLERVTSTFPWLTYGRIEFTANIVLFAPLAWCAARGWPRWHAFVVPAGLMASVIIEVLQGLLLAQRTASVLDVVANTLGAGVGWLLARPWRWRAARSRARSVSDATRQPASGA